jgi:uncharacterized protein involved in type VI secretion and phage assembly
VSRNYGVVIGLVRDVDDPLGEGRIRVHFPWLADEVMSGWAPIVRPMAGRDRGHYFMPEIDDEALVAFEHGDFDHPFVIGFLHNGVDVPPDDDIDVHVRRLKTVQGHVLQFDDRAGRGEVRLSTAGGQSVVMQDLPKRVEISTATGTTITLDDAPSRVEVRTAAGVSVQVTDAGVSVNAAAAPLSVNAVAASVNATGGCSITTPAFSVNSPLATFSGVVQCSSLVAGAVVSGSYTPGIGNLL